MPPRKPLDPREAAVGLALRGARQARRKSAEDVAAAAGVIPNLVYKIEAGQRCPSVLVLFHLCDAIGMGCRPSEILGEAESIAWTAERKESK